MYAVVSTSKHDTSPTIEMVLTGVTSYNEALQYLIDHWGDSDNVLSDHFDCWHSDVDTLSKLKERLAEFNSRSLAFHILPIGNIVAVDRTVLGTPSDETKDMQKRGKADENKETNERFLIVVSPNGYDAAYNYLVRVASICQMIGDDLEAVGLGRRTQDGTVVIIVRCDPAEIRKLEATRPRWFVYAQPARHEEEELSE